MLDTNMVQEHNVYTGAHFTHTHVPHGCVGPQGVHSGSIFIRYYVGEYLVLVYLVYHHASDEVLSQLIIVEVVGTDLQHFGRANVYSAVQQVVPEKNI